jgi:hypothetical protein
MPPYKKAKDLEVGDIYKHTIGGDNGPEWVRIADDDPRNTGRHALPCVSLAQWNKPGVKARYSPEDSDVIISGRVPVPGAKVPRKDLSPGTIYIHAGGDPRAAIERTDPRNKSNYEFPSVLASEFKIPTAGVMHLNGPAIVEVKGIVDEAPTPDKPDNPDEKVRYTGKRFIHTNSGGDFLVITNEEMRKMKNATGKIGTPVALLKTGEIRFVRKEMDSQVQDPQPGDILTLKSGEEGIMLVKVNRHPAPGGYVMAVPTPDNEMQHETPGVLRMVKNDKITKEWD